MIKPLSPSEALQHRMQDLPSEVVAAVNEIIKLRWRGSGNFIVKQEEIVQEIIAQFHQAGKDVTRHDIFHNKWLDFELLFETVGWHIIYDKPSIGDGYDAYFKFTATTGV